MNDNLYFKYGEKEINHLRKMDKKLGAVIGHVGIIKRPVNPDVFSALVESIVSQQISSKAANTVCLKLHNLCGIEAERLAALTVEEIQSCGMSMRKAGCVKGVAEAALNKSIDFDSLSGMSDNEIITALTTLKGVGV